MFSPLRRILMLMSCLLALTSMTAVSVAQQLCSGTTPCVTTWHNDLNRTGWQQDETLLTAAPSQPGTVNQSTFGLLYQWKPVNGIGIVYAQPLAVSEVPVSGCTPPNCPNVVFVATEEDMLYAFNATSSTGATIWPALNLAGYLGGAFINCKTDTTKWSVCTGKTDEGLSSPFSNMDVGVTGTPVIDPTTNTLYVVAAVEISNVVNYYLFAVDITSGIVKAYTQIAGSVPGSQTPPTPKCTTGGTGTTQSFDNSHIQRSGLLLLNGIVYVSFAPLPEAKESGWMFGYWLSDNTGSNYNLSQASAFSSTPHGTGGGIWGSGAAPASIGGDIFVATGNGTFDLQQNPADVDAGDSLLKLQPPTPPYTLLTISDFYTPYDVFSFPNNGLCPNDEDFGSGGVLLPPNFTYTNSGTCSGAGCKVAITADKQSNIYVMDQAELGGLNAGTSCAGSTNNIQCITTPTFPANNPTQGYWASPAYWFDGTHYWLYYSATMNGSALLCNGALCQGGFGPPGVSPEALNAYQLQTSGSPGPILSATPYASSGTSNPYPILFCDYAPTPSVSSNPQAPAGSGIVWAIEQDQNNDNNPNNTNYPQDCAPPQANGSGGHTNSKNPVALHAFNATTMAEIYTSRGLSQAHQPGLVNAFPTPTVFNGQVYIGTNTEIDVFGLCVNGSGGQCLH
jgi:hypothetical protein